MSFAALPADERMGGYESESDRLLGGTPGPRSDPQSLPADIAAERARTSRLKEWSCIILGAFALIVATLVVVTHSHGSSAAAAAHDSSLKVVASENDDRQYRFTALDNGLEVLLVSDPSTSRSAAAMDVRVGHFSDPDYLPGLAHFLEHMLFLGTKKYPREDYFEELLTRQGGSSNAFTAEEDTNFFFDVDPTGFQEALEVWSQFFVEPLFNANATDREMHAVDSEHSKNQQDDEWRISQLLSSTSNADHPFHKFGTGNLHTLKDRPRDAGIDVRKELLKFYRRHYSANLMRLCVLGKEPLDELEALVESLFEAVPNRNLAAPVFGKHPVRRQNSMGRIYSVRSVDQQRRLQLYWVLAPQVPEYRSKSVEVLSSLVGHEGTGSLLSHLRQRGWANAILAGPDLDASDFTLFKVDVSLTERGLSHVDSVIESVFAYVALLNQGGIDEWRWVESKKLTDLDFKFQEKAEPADYVSDLAGRMQLYPPTDVLAAPYLFEEWDPEALRGLVLELRPEQVVAFVISSSFKRSQLKKREPWYGTPYAEDLITPSQLRAWAAPRKEVIAHFVLPPRNTFIPADLSIHHRAKKPPKTKPTMFPAAVSDSGKLRLWYAPDDLYNRPRANLYFAFRAPVASASPRDRILSLLFCDAFADAFKEESYPARVAGISYSLDTTGTGFSLLVSGYNDRIIDFLTLLFQRLRAVSVDEQRFPALLERLRRSLDSMDNTLSVKVASRRLSALLESTAFSPEELRSAAKESVAPSDVEEHARKALSAMYVEAMVQGNLEEGDARNVAVQVVETLGYTALPASRWAQRSTRKLVPGKLHTLFMPVPNAEEPNSAVAIECQIGPETAKQRVLTSLLASWLDERAFNRLRTVEQLGYIAGASAKLRHGILSLAVYVQSSHKDASFLQRRVEAFLSSVYQPLRDMEQADFDALRASRARQLLSPYASQSSMADALWEEVELGRYAFNRAQEQAALLTRITLEDVMELFESATDAARARKLVVGVFGQGRKLPSRILGRIKDVAAFRAAQPTWSPKVRSSVPDAGELTAQAKADGETARQGLTALEEAAEEEKKATGGVLPEQGPGGEQELGASAATGATGATGLTSTVTELAKTFAKAISPDGVPAVSPMPDTSTPGYALAAAQQEATRARARARDGSGSGDEGEGEAEEAASPPWAQMPLTETLPGGMPVMAGAVGPEEEAGVGDGPGPGDSPDAQVAAAERREAEQEQEEQEQEQEEEEAEEEEAEEERSREMQEAAQEEEQLAMAREAQQQRGPGGRPVGPRTAVGDAGERAAVEEAYRRWLDQQGAVPGSAGAAVPGTGSPGEGSLRGKHTRRRASPGAAHKGAGSRKAPKEAAAPHRKGHGTRNKGHRARGRRHE